MKKKYKQQQSDYIKKNLSLVPEEDEYDMRKAR